MIMILTYFYDAFKKILYNIIVGWCDQREKILALKKRLICSTKKNLDEFDNSDKYNSSDELFELIELDYVKQNQPIHTIKTNFKSNTSPNLTINKQPLEINNKSFTYLNIVSNRDLPLHNPVWYCKFCNKKLLYYSNIYCCNDNIFCTPNCRDRYLNYSRLNNNI